MHKRIRAMNQIIETFNLSFLTVEQSDTEITAKKKK